MEKIISVKVLMMEVHVSMLLYHYFAEVAFDR